MENIVRRRYLWLVLSLLIIGHALLINRRRALAELNHQELQIERGIG